MLRFAPPACLALLLGCTAAGGPPGSASADVNAVAKGAMTYRDHCSVCHGARGQGGIGPVLAGTRRSADDLAQVISATMPKSNPGSCQGTCASDVAAFILAGFPKAAPPTCGTDFSSPRRLRLLTHREYRATLADLLPSLTTPGGGNCGATTFTFYPEGRTPSTVHAAGTFNGWAGTIAAGGWPMAYQAGPGVWTVQRTLQPGSYQYKFVLDEKTWVADDHDPATAPDGYGGQNSVLSVSCSGSPQLPFDPLDGAAADTRVAGFLFDNHADARLVTEVEVDQFLAAGKTVADAAAANWKAVVGCDLGADRQGCGAQWVKSFGLRAFRRPLTDAEAGRYQALLASQPDPQQAVSLTLQVFLSSPNFLYRSEMGQDLGDGGYRLTGYEVASALSYLLWGTMPDQALFDAAAKGELDAPQGIEAQARRLLADNRAGDAIGAFALQWLGGDQVLLATKAASFPLFTSDVKSYMAQETQRLSSYVVLHSSGRLDELFTAGYSFLNGALDAVYGLGGGGEDLQKQAYGDGRRLGVLGHGSVLASYAYPDQTSPVRRGLFVRRNLLCQDLPPPPALPGAGAVPPAGPDTTTRQRFDQHDTDPQCSVCHRFLDPVGYGFEHFDPIGAWRDQDAGQPVDSSGALRDVEELGSGTAATFSGLPELVALLLASDNARTCFMRQYTRFARGVLDTPDDLCAQTRILGQFRDSGYDVRQLMLAVTLSPDFVLRH